VAFGLLNVPSYELALPGVRLAPISGESDAARFDLTIWMREDGDRLAANWTYRTDLFAAATIAGLHAGFAALLASAVASPLTRLNDLELVSAAVRDERQRQRLERESANQARLRKSGRTSVRQAG
jgi:non-ribosomal peptide synthetase component F